MADVLMFVRATGPERTGTRLCAPKAQVPKRLLWIQLAHDLPKHFG
jgi:hypothetical protein